MNFTHGVVLLALSRNQENRIHKVWSYILCFVIHFMASKQRIYARIVPEEVSNIQCWNKFWPTIQWRLTNLDPETPAVQEFGDKTTIEMKYYMFIKRVYKVSMLSLFSKRIAMLQQIFILIQLIYQKYGYPSWVCLSEWGDHKA